MNKINYNNILKTFIIFIVIYSLLKIIPSNEIETKDIILIISINLILFYILLNYIYY